MASKKSTLRGSRRVLSVGLVNVPVKLATFTSSTSVRGTRLCPDHEVPVKSGVATCSHDGHDVDEPITGYEYGGGYVTGVDRSEHTAEKDAAIELRYAVELDEL